MNGSEKSLQLINKESFITAHERNQQHARSDSYESSLYGEAESNYDKVSRGSKEFTAALNSSYEQRGMQS